MASPFADCVVAPPAVEVVPPLAPVVLAFERRAEVALKVPPALLVDCVALPPRARVVVEGLPPLPLAARVDFVEGLPPALLTSSGAVVCRVSILPPVPFALLVVAPPLLVRAAAVPPVPPIPPIPSVEDASDGEVLLPQAMHSAEA